MKFGSVPLNNAIGKILGHNIANENGRRALRKGRALTAEDINLLKRLGRTVVYVADIEPNDVEENEAARQIAKAVMGNGIRFTGPSTGRCNLIAKEIGILRVDVLRLNQLNGCLGITLATRRTNMPISPKMMVGTVKIIPYAVPEKTLATALNVARNSAPLITIEPLPARKTAVILSGSPTAQTRTLNSFDPPLRGRIEGLGSSMDWVDFVPLEDEQGEIDLANMLQEKVSAGAELIVLAGETAVQDRYDIQPRAIERAGGNIICFGAPVDPGNLLVLATLQGVPILGAPGCARSPKANIVDYVLPRLLAGDQLTQADIIALGHGGLLEDTLLRGVPRKKIGSS